jgi:hypothetical protein
MRKFLICCDLIGPSPGFYIDNEKRIKTTLGGIFTIIFSILLSVCIYWSCFDVFVRINPHVIRKKNLKITNDLLFNNFSFILGLSYGHNYLPIKNIEQKLSIRLRYFNLNDSVSEYNYIDLVPCYSWSSIELKMDLNNINYDLNSINLSSYCLKDSSISSKNRKLNVEKYDIYQFVIK